MLNSQIHNGRHLTLLCISIPALLVISLTTFTMPAQACGGFFCQQTPIDQAGEQIVFRQQGNEMTAMVRILYEGDAESFSWVVPVPNIPEVMLGDDGTFVDLDLTTRPQFNLERRGQSCEAIAQSASGSDDIDTGGESGSDGGVNILSEFSLGGFDVQIVSGGAADPEAMANWLIENEYDLSDRGRELLAPYVNAEMVFVALKLRNGASTGSIQPLVMKYQTEKPMIPIRLTAVAAMPDMGILTWVVADERAVPENYLHVVPNYARLNWYSGSQNAYASYQTLITDAMNEVAAGEANNNGQGFATDYAGPITANIISGLSPSVQRKADLEFELAGLSALDDQPAEYIARALRDRGAGTPRLLPVQTELPQPDDQDISLYFDATRLRQTFTNEQLLSAKIALAENIQKTELEALETSLDLFPENAYMTRLYTTLSADEMSIDPVFGYNAEMPEQVLTRNAILEQSCGDDGNTSWTLTLGEGTGRNGEVVISAIQPTPFSAPNAVTDLDAAFQQDRTSGDAMPTLVARSVESTLEIAADGSATQSTDTGGTGTQTPVVAGSKDDDDGFLGRQGPLSIGLLAVFLMLRRRYAAKHVMN